MPQYYSYTPTDIKFAVASSENLQIAQATYFSTSLYNTDALTDVVEPVTFAQGLITVTASSSAVTGVDTQFEVDFKPGQFLYYYNNQGDPVLAGRISTISSDTTLTLTDVFAGTTQANVNCGMTTKIFLVNDDFIVRIPTQIINNGNGLVLPNWAVYKSTNGQSNNSANIALNRYSLVNSPATAATPPLANVPFQIRTYGRSDEQWESQASGQDLYYFASWDNLPKYAYARLSLYPGSTQLLSANTLYSFFINNNIPNNGIVATNNGQGLPEQDLIDAGYNL
jgi:hypothetical protein